MPTIDLGRITLHYEINGNGPKLLLIGGTGWDLRRPKSPFERTLHQHFEVLRFDQRGQGQSAKPDVAYSMQDYAEDCAALLDALAWPAVPVLAISFGGMVGQEFTLRHPEKVTRLILACTSSGGAGGASFPIHSLQDLSPDEYAERFQLLANRSRDAAWQAANPALYKAIVQDMKASRDMSSAEWIGLQRQLAARITHDTWDRLPQLQMPVLVCGGEMDDICPPQNLHNLARQIPHAQLQIFHGGHGFYMEDAQVLPSVLAFLRA